jgi:hypothetical protein
MDITWRKAFMEITLRAFRKLHIEYGAWGIGQSSNDTTKWKNLNVGHGVELALETTVCAAISQEFINSPFTNGLHLKSNDRKARKYEINREVTIKRSEVKDDEKRVDLFINRYKDISGEIVFYKYPVIIEAKRAHYFTSDISIGLRSEKIEKVNGYNGLKEDLSKLREIRNIIKSKKFIIKASGYENQKEESQLKNAFLYLLFWGITEVHAGNEKWAKEPYEMAEKIESKLLTDNNYELKWMPLKWDFLSEKNCSGHPEVTEWLWIMLVEVDQNNIGHPPYKDSKYWFKKC